MKINRIGILLLFVITLSTTSLVGQNSSEIRINEILIENSDNITDSYGAKSGWIELFNTAHGTVDIGGCYISDDPNNLKKYQIPRGDASTAIPPRQIKLFYADGDSYKGTYHINFTITDAKEILFISNDGRTIVDRVQIPHGSLSENSSYGRVIDGEKEWAVFENPTPGSVNKPHTGISAGEKFKAIDPVGVIMALTAMSVVFLALILLYIVFKQVGNHNIRLTQKRSATVAGKGAESVGGAEASAEVFAAIATAVHLHLTEEEVHDVESAIITMEKVERSYSPWSSKIYTLREVPHKQ